MGSGLISLGVWIYYLSHELAPNMNVTQGAIAALLLLAFAGTGALIASGQVLFLIFLPLTIAWVYARQGKWTPTGALLGLAASLKIFLLIFIPFLLLRRQYKASVTFCVTFVSVFCLGFLVFGLENYVSWVHTLTLVNWNCDVSNASLLGFLIRTFSETPIFSQTFPAPNLVTPLWAISSGIVGLLTFYYTTFDNSTNSVDRAFAMLIISALLISPLGWTYYWFFAVGPTLSLVISWWQELRSKNLFEQSQLFKLKILFIIIAIPGLLWPRELGRMFQPRSLGYRHPRVNILLEYIGHMDKPCY